MANMINWFEIPVSDFDRAENFYNQIFNFKMERNQMGDFLMGFFPYGSGDVTGAIVKGKGYVPDGKGTLIYFNGGEDLSGILSKVDAAGGKVAVPKTLINEQIGFFAIFFDTEGNKLALHSTK